VLAIWVTQGDVVLILGAQFGTVHVLLIRVNQALEAAVRLAGKLGRAAGCICQVGLVFAVGLFVLWLQLICTV
jgi:hypothetical protein